MATTGVTATGMATRRMSAMATWMAGSQGTGRERYAPQGDGRGKSDKCSMKHVNLL
jgi:hypothetical protein